MVRKQTAISTGRKFSGPPSELDKTETPIFRQVIQYSYFLINTYPHLTSFAISKLIAKDLVDIWKAVNPRLPLLNEKSIVNKVNIICFQKAKQINRKSLPVAQIKILEEKLDTLFDISSCSCELPILSCDNNNVKCNKENCQTKHIVCTCRLKIPVEEREYLKDKRAKMGFKGTFQLGPINKAAIKKCKRKKEKLVDRQKKFKKVDSSPIASTSSDQDAVFSHSPLSTTSEKNSR